MQPGEVLLAPDGPAADAVVVLQLGSNRNAIYKTLFDARPKLRAALAANGYPITAGDSAGVVPADVDAGRRP